MIINQLDKKMPNKKNQGSIYSPKTKQAIKKFKSYSNKTNSINFMNEAGFSQNIYNILNSFKRRFSILIAVLSIFFISMIFAYSNSTKPLSKLSVSGVSQDILYFDSFSSTVEVAYLLPENQPSDKIQETKLVNIRNDYAALGFDKSTFEFINSFDLINENSQRQQILTIKFNFENAQESQSRSLDFLRSLSTHGKISYYPIEYPQELVTSACEKVQIKAIKIAKEKGENMVKEIGGKQVLSIESNSFSPCPKTDIENQNQSNDIFNISPEIPEIVLNKSVSSEAFITLQFI